MIIVIGTIVAKPDQCESVRRLSEQHVARSRKEPGCIAHDVSVHSDNPNKFVFVEFWSDLNALKQHFAEPSSQLFVTTLREMIDGKPSMRIFNADEVSV
ncbi:MAG: putative quinol monooxygenase [Woeseiaceae bacterium]